ncbi:MAG: hypothetical protein Q4B17_14710 [Lautropia sp.]|nr:hypothetical protein [Lautropia sp.]
MKIVHTTLALLLAESTMAAPSPPAGASPGTGRYLQPQVSALPNGNPYLFMGGNPLGTAWHG